MNVRTEAKVASSVTGEGCQLLNFCWTGQDYMYIDKNYFALLLVTYNLQRHKITPVEDVTL